MNYNAVVSHAQYTGICLGTKFGNESYAFYFAWQASIVDFSINLAWVACSVNHLNIDAGFNNRSSPKSM